MRKIVLDFESFYSREYSLRRMTPIEYILGREWETIGCAVCIDDKPPVWLEGDRVERLLRMVQGDWMCITHNALFDCCILAYRYDIHPTLCVDTMSMARALLAPFLPGRRVSLEVVAEHLGVGVKDKIALGNVLGMRLAQIKARDETHYQPLIKYALEDARMTRDIFRQLSSGKFGRFPATEYIVNDMIIRMATRPAFGVDMDKLYAHQANITAEKSALLARVGVEKPQLMSNDKFAELLRGLGVEPAKKVSLTTGELTYAFAKTDEFMDELQEHPDPAVQALVAARIGHKSTLEETRTQRFINIGLVTSGSMPVALRYAGAHTHRFSGDWKLNQQNLPSRKGKLLRESMVAPPGRVVLAADAAQIEARLTAWLARQQDLVEQFARGEDVYSIFGTGLYGYPVSKKTPMERLLSKFCVLGLGFGMGASKFENTVRIESAKSGIEVTLPKSPDEIVSYYRWKNGKIRTSWRILDDLILKMHAGKAEGVKFGPMTFGNDRIVGPTGLTLYYPDLRNGEYGWSYYDGQKRKPIWGGTMLENIVQHLDRVVVMEAAVRLRKRIKDAGLDMEFLAHQVHDELVYVPREEDAEALLSVVVEEMARVPEWAAGLPLAAEANIGPNFGATK